MPSPWTLPALALSLTFALGCASSKPLTPNDAAAGMGGTGNAGVGGGDGGSAGRAGITACPAPGYSSASAPVVIDEVDAQLVDAQGAPTANVKVQVCGLDACFYGTSNAAGKTSVVPASALTSPAFKYGDGFGFARLAIALDSSAKQDLGQLVALPLPDYSAGAAFPSAGEVSNGDLTLVLAPGTAVVHDVLTYSDDSELVFRSVPIPLAQSSRAVDPSLAFELAFGVAPLGTTFCPGAALRVGNALAWAAGTAVEVFVQGLETNQDWAPYGGWVKVADASVSADARSIETTSGGIPILSSIALRRKSP